MHFIVFIVHKICNQIRGSQWITSHFHGWENVLNIHRAIVFCHKGLNTPSFVEKWIQTKGISLSEISDTHKDQFYTLSFVGR